MVVKFIVHQADSTELAMTPNVNVKLDIKLSDGTPLELILTDE